MAERTLMLDDVRISLGGTELLAVDLTVNAGEVVTIMGPSGSGKSTLLAWLTGNLPSAFAASGRALLGGTDISNLPPEQRRMGILFQDDLLFPHMSVGQNLSFGLRGPDRKSRIADALASVGLEGFEGRDPATLSGGQRSRVALMRMLLSEPKALLLDEPFAKLDAELRGQVRDLVFKHAKNQGLPVLMVTHDVADAEAAGGRVITLRS
ncbi:ATP-binding cassette domain-containing protein [Marivivens donghaensis]|uniref:ATP-binding cassette domain-containing protein n=1 Tax=Marivivens donghaensis TaxID=1699413 RepID=A0ABX0VXL4_9RHOB|nr:ATP-binding cassette domain-containing protein [Marivivens donghaensis]NIY71397.1 ATP-binding cassette domain-containing protein [Marivivens donghaensis]